MKKILLLIIAFCLFLFCCKKSNNTMYYVKIVDGLTTEDTNEIYKFYETTKENNDSSITIEISSFGTDKTYIIDYHNGVYHYSSGDDTIAFKYLNYSIRNYKIEGFIYDGGVDYYLTNDENISSDLIYYKMQHNKDTYNLETDGVIIYSTYKQIKLLFDNSSTTKVIYSNPEQREYEINEIISETSLKLINSLEFKKDSNMESLKDNYDLVISMNRDVVIDSEDYLTGLSNKSISVYYYFDFENKNVRMQYLTNSLHSDLYAEIDDSVIQTIKNEMFKVCIKKNGYTNSGDYLLRKGNQEIILKLDNDGHALITNGNLTENGSYTINNTLSNGRDTISFDIILSTNNGHNTYCFFVENKKSAGCLYVGERSNPSSFFGDTLKNDDFLLWIGSKDRSE